MTNNDFARNADALESSNHAAELTARAHAALCALGIDALSLAA